MLSKAQNKHIRALAMQKFRDEYRLFIAEGNKIASEWLAYGRPVAMIVATSHWLRENSALIRLHPGAELLEAGEADMAAISQLASPPPVLLVIPYPEYDAFVPERQWYLALDGIQDPGNLGSIIRIADWFGITDILCSEHCVDAYNHKVVQGAMGSHLRVRIHKTDLPAALSAAGLPLYVATLSGDNVYQMQGRDPGILVIGSEGRGVSASIFSLPVSEVTIPRVGRAESLNAAVSAGILCSWLLQR